MKTFPRTLRARLGDDVIELAIRLGILGFLIYWTFVLVRPFIPILLWSIVLAVALYPAFDWLARRLGDRRALAATLITAVGLAVVIGPATWLGLGLVEGLRALSEQFSAGAVSVPPPTSVKAWPVIGLPLFEAWDLASSNLESTLRRIAPQLKLLGRPILNLAGSAGAGVLTFLASVVLAGFLFGPGPRLVAGCRALLLRIAPRRSGEFVDLAGTAIRSVARGVIGISLLQALLAGIGFKLVDLPGASVLALLVLGFGIVQLGASLVVLPVLIWGWTTLDTTTAVLFTIYMIFVNFIDNALKPFVMGHGLKTPMLVIFVGVIGGTLAHGLIGLFVGPVVLAVAWELLMAWTEDGEEESPPREEAAAGPPQAVTDPS